jgi:hypothetical protein
LSPIDTIDGLLAGITRRDIEMLEPALAKRLALALRRIADLADPPNTPRAPKSGVLADLRNGNRAG